MLKRLRLLAEIKQRNAELADLLERKAGFKKKQDELSKALEEASTEEDINLISDNIKELEKEVDEAGIEEKETNVRAEITRIEGELAELDSKEPQSEPTAPTKPKTENSKENREVKTTMKTRGILFGVGYEQRNKIMAQDDVKSFLARCRELKGQNRSVTGGELVIPDVFLELIRDNLNKYSKLITKVRVKSVSGKARQTIAGTVPEAIWTEMISNLNELNISFNQVEVDGYAVGGYIAIANSTLEDSDLDLAAEILEALAQAIGLGIDKAIIAGTGVRMPLGILTRLSQSAQPSDYNSNEPKWKDLHESNIIKFDGSTLTGVEFFATLMEKLSIPKANYSNGGKFWLMNTKTKSIIMAKALNFNAAGALVSAANNELPVIGGEIITFDFLADGDIIGGYGDLYLLAERQGSTFESSNIPRFLQDQTVFKGKARYDGKPIFGEGFVIVNILNTNPTVTLIFAGDEANVDLVSLSELKIGATPVTLFPPFDKNVLNYHCKVSTHANKITAVALKSEANVVIKNGATSVNNGSNATFTAGENTLTIEVTNGNATKRTYSVIVEDETT